MTDATEKTASESNGVSSPTSPASGRARPIGRSQSDASQLGLGHLALYEEEGASNMLPLAAYLRSLAGIDTSTEPSKASGGHSFSVSAAISVSPLIGFITSY